MSDYPCTPYDLEMCMTDRRNGHTAAMQTAQRQQHHAPWTVDSVKAALPEVEVRSGALTFPALVSGRMHRVATVSAQSDQGRWESWQFAWSTVAESLNTGTPLTI